MDELILSGAGGYGSRAEFIREAVEALVLETTYSEASGERTGGPRQEENSAPPRPSGGASGCASGSAPVSPPSFTLAETEIRVSSRGYVVADGLAEVRDEPMFGLHNRDYPSIWAASRIATRTVDAPMQIDSLFKGLVADAWQYAKKLSALEESLSRKLTALFPTNERKSQSAASAFLDFAVGGYVLNCNEHEGDQKIVGRGPLFKWGVVQVEKQDDHLVAALTASGYDMLEALNGISLDLPHSQQGAKWFCGFLRHASPADWSGFATVLHACREAPTRSDLTAAFCQSYPEWGPKKAGNYLTGYVARSREWGLLEPKLVDRRYRLTELGKRQLEVERRQAG
jgi:hypothetical protein